MTMTLNKINPPESLVDKRKARLSGALGETRTPMGLPPVDFESTASTNSATRAQQSHISQRDLTSPIHPAFIR
jgi:hypothetical protein